MAEGMINQISFSTPSHSQINISIHHFTIIQIQNTHTKLHNFNNFYEEILIFFKYFF